MTHLTAEIVSVLNDLRTEQFHLLDKGITAPEVDKGYLRGIAAAIRLTEKAIERHKDQA